MTTFEIISKEQALALAQYDADHGSITTTPEDYAYYNAESYYLITNIWLNIATEVAPISAEVLKQMLLRKGVLAAIKLLNEEADKFVHGKEAEFLPFSLSLYNEIERKEKDRIFLLVLRFGKRFSPNKADCLHDATIADFLQTENRSKMLQRKEYSVFLTQLMRSFITEVFPRGIKVRPEDRYFSSGTCADARRLYQKVNVAALYSGRPYGLYGDPRWAFMPLNGTISPDAASFHNQFVASQIRDHKGSYGYNPPIFEQKIAEVEAVNKSYKAARIIAKETASRQFDNSAILVSLIASMKRSKFWKEFQIEDQEMNRSFCRSASIGCDYSTIDLSHASDCVTKVLLRDVLPSKLQFIVSCLPDTIRVGGKKKPLQMGATAGCILTFVLETLVFWSAARTAKYLFESLTGEQCGNVSIYGDDIIVPEQITDLMIDILETLGFMVNHDKTFSGAHPYRETCGAEYLNGIDVASQYFPRKTLKWNGSLKKIKKGPDTNKSLVSIVELQHKLYEFARVRLFLCDFVRSIYPNFSSSNPAEGYSDLWEEFPLPVTVTPPVDSGCPVPECAKREGHFSPVVTYKSKSDRYSIARDMFEYRRFLKDGPQFKDPLMKALGCSDAPMSLAQGTGDPEIIWKVLS